jgi:hypothetical protein
VQARDLARRAPLPPPPSADRIDPFDVHTDGDAGDGRAPLRQGKEYHSFQRARDALFALMRMAEGKLDRGGAYRRAFVAKVRELWADLADESVDLFAHFFLKQLAKWCGRQQPPHTHMHTYTYTSTHTHIHKHVPERTG